MPKTGESGWNELREALRRITVPVARLVAAAMMVLPVSVGAVCVGDCSGDCEVTVDEIVTMVNVALGSGNVSTCPRGDADGSGEITIDEIIGAVNSALLGCSCSAGCGNGQVDAGEDCDDGGLCVGGRKAGTACTADAQCEGDGICQGGPHFGRPCASSDECPNGACVHCVTFGGDGCAANCTNEIDVPCTLVPGRAVGQGIAAGTSGVVAHGDPISLVLPIQGSEMLTVGKPGADGTIPVVIKAGLVSFERTTVALGCACFRAAAFKTCGGTIFERDGSPSPSCTDGFASTTECAADRPCSFVHGPGNSANGIVACGDGGLAGVDLSFTQDAGACDDPPDCTMRSPRPLMTSVGGQGPQGSVLLFSTTATGSVTGACPPTFCSDADPPSMRGTPSVLVFTTGNASAALQNANAQDGADIGPFALQGMPLVCSKLRQNPPDASGFATVGAFPFLAQPRLGDIVSTSQAFCQ